MATSRPTPLWKVNWCVAKLPTHQSHRRDDLMMHLLLSVCPYGNASCELRNQVRMHALAQIRLRVMLWYEIIRAIETDRRMATRCASTVQRKSFRFWRLRSSNSCLMYARKQAQGST